MTFLLDLRVLEIGWMAGCMEPGRGRGALGLGVRIVMILRRINLKQKRKEPASDLATSEVDINIGVIDYCAPQFQIM